MIELNNVTDKVGVLDVEAILEDGTIVNIEMQNQEYSEYHKRILYYASSTFIIMIQKDAKNFRKDIYVWKKNP